MDISECLLEHGLFGWVFYILTGMALDRLARGDFPFIGFSKELFILNPHYLV